MLSGSVLVLLLCFSALASGYCPKPNITQTLVTSWTSESQAYSQWQVQITNGGDEALLFVSLNISQGLSQYWEIKGSSSGIFTLPEWRDQDGIPAYGMHTFGYIALGSDPLNITVKHYVCAPGEELYIVSTVQAFAAGLYGGTYPVRHLLRHGDFGLGAFDGINGEMIVLDGHIYHAYSNGSVLEAEDSELALWASVVHFYSSTSYNISSPSSMADLDSFILSVIPTNNFFYALKIHGHFSSVTTRAIPLLSPPYPPLADAINMQVIFTKANVTGTAVVIRSPPFTSVFSPVGDHFHFISDDHMFGGHALNLTLTDGTIELQQIRTFSVWLPDSDDFKNADFSA